MTRGAPAEVVGQVEVFAPTGTNPYYRLRWTEPDGSPGDTSAGREPAGAVAKAAVVDRRLAGAAGPAAMAPLGRVFREYLAAGCSPYTGRPWRRSTRTQIADNLGRTLRGHEDVRALDLTRPDGHQSG